MGALLASRCAVDVATDVDVARSGGTWLPLLQRRTAAVQQCSCEHRHTGPALASNEGCVVRHGGLLQHAPRRENTSGAAPTRLCLSFGRTGRICPAEHARRPAAAAGLPTSKRMQANFRSVNGIRMLQAQAGDVAGRQ